MSKYTESLHSMLGLLLGKFSRLQWFDFLHLPWSVAGFFSSNGGGAMKTSFYFERKR